MVILIIVSAFLTTLFLAYNILKYIYIKQNAIVRLKKFINVEEVKERKKQSSHKEYKTGLSFIAKGIGSAKFMDNYKKNVQQQLTRGHLLLKAEEFITICLILSLISGFLVFVISNSILFTIMVSISGWLLPTFVLRFRIKKRVKNLNDQLADAIVLISNSLKAGYSFFQAVDIVAKEMTGPIAEEFALLQKEVNLGQTTERALENLVSRVKSDDLELVVIAVLIQRQIGGNLSEILDNISSTIRERIRIKGEVKTVTAQGRASGLIISLLPVGLCLILFIINPEYISALFTDPIGIVIVIFSVMMELIGIYFISKVVKIDI